MKTPWKDGLPFPLETIAIRCDDDADAKALARLLPKLRVILTSGTLGMSLRADQIFEPLVSVNTAWDRRPLWSMNPHPFMGGGSGTPDRPCMVCGLPDRDPIHKTPDGSNMLTTTHTALVRCGNCKKQYEVPTAQPWRYRAVQQHKFACTQGRTEAVEAQHAQLVEEFRQQQQRARTKPRWWKFWRRQP